MAYSNWGAFVYKNGERQRDREDVPTFGDADVEAVPSGARIWVNLLKAARQPSGTEGQQWVDRCHHAVLGSDHVRLIGHKSYPQLYRITEQGIEEIELLPEDQDWWDVGEISGEIDGYKYEATLGEDPEHVQLKLTEPDGTVWTAKSGYCMGAGWDDCE